MSDIRYSHSVCVGSPCRCLTVCTADTESVLTVSNTDESDSETLSVVRSVITAAVIQAERIPSFSVSAVLKQV